MPQFTIKAQDAERSSHTSDIRFMELASQSWDRKKSALLAQSEGLVLNDEHWAVIIYLRRHYLEHGLPENARALDEILSRQFSALGGRKYLRGLFPGGPVTQGSRLGNLRTPANTTDDSFGGSY